MGNNTADGIKKKGMLAWIERIGNKMPHPVALFIYITIIVLVASFIFGMLGTSALHPSTGEVIQVRNLVSLDGLLLFILNFVNNLQTFPVLAIALILGIASGVCDRGGLFSTIIKMGLKNVKGNAVVFIIAFIGVLANEAGDAAFILIPPIVGAIFYGLGRHPLAGVFLGYATVGGGYSTSILPTAVDILLTPITISSAQNLVPDFDMSMLGGYYFLFVSGLLCALAASFITLKVIEPMLGTYKGSSVEGEDSSVSPEEAKAAKKAGLAVLGFVVLLVAICIPQNSFLRNPENGSLLQNSPLMKGLQFFIICIFLIAGFIYAVSMGKVKSFSQAVDMMSDSVRTMAPFVVLAVIIGQFLFLFNQSNLAQIIAIRGGEFLAGLSVPTQIIILLFFLLSAFVNLFIGSGSTKWLLMAPIFVPMLMQLNVHPIFIQSVYRLGDCCTNHLTPLFAYFAILLTTTQKYDEKAGMGTLFSAMLPYAGAFILVYAIQILVWVTFNLPIGIGGQIWLS